MLLAEQTSKQIVRSSVGTLGLVWISLNRLLMFLERTVFVVGAGASAECNMPTGADLAERISQSLHFEFDFSSEPKQGADHAMFRHIRRLAEASKIEINAYLAEARQISTGVLHAGSIDEYLYRHADRPLHSILGKLAILHHIARAERKSRLFVSDDAKAADVVEAGKSTWLREFCQILCSGRTASDLDRLFDGLTIINFNYDRCIQRYLSAYIQVAYHVTDSIADVLVEKLDIRHPYGSLGPLKSSGAELFFRFGAQSEHQRFERMLENIRTFNESHSDAELSSEDLRTAIREARQIVFLGFGFHKQNLDILAPPTERSKAASRVIATAFGLSVPNADGVKSRLYRLVSKTDPKIAVERDMKAVDLLRDYRMIIST